MIGRYQGQSDVPLNDTGKAQARVLADKLASEPFSAIYSSDLQRAFQTAQAIAEKVHLPVQLDTRLREINQGEWEGQLVTVIQEKYSHLWQDRKTDPANFRPPAGETILEVAVRFQAALAEICARHSNQKVLIVSHGLAIATAICHSKNIPLGQAYNWIPENTSQVWLDWKE